MRLRLLCILLAITGPSMAGSLPPAVDLTAQQWFPRIIAQEGSSCAQHVGLYYMMAAEAGRSTGQPTALSPYFAYTVISGSRSGRTHLTDGWLLSGEMGVPSLMDSPRYSTRLMDGYEKYRRALAWRADSWQIHPVMNEEQIAAVCDRLARGHLLGCDFQVKGTKLRTFPKGHPMAGQTIITEWSNSGPGHTMLYAGYDQTLGWDVNGDGAITTDRDIDGDARLTIADSERGAFLLVNPWGPRWGNRGRAWVLFRTHSLSRWARGRSVAELTLAPPALPRRMLRISLKAADRQNLTLRITGSRGQTVQPMIFDHRTRSPLHPSSAWDAFSHFARPGAHVSPGGLAGASGGPLEMGFDLSAAGPGPWRMDILPVKGPLRATVTAAEVIEYARDGQIAARWPFQAISGLPLPPAGTSWSSAQK